MLSVNGLKYLFGIIANSQVDELVESAYKCLTMISKQNEMISFVPKNIFRWIATMSPPFYLITPTISIRLSYTCYICWEVCCKVRIILNHKNLCYNSRRYTTSSKPQMIHNPLKSPSTALCCWWIILCLSKVLTKSKSFPYYRRLSETNKTTLS
jgi:hypothetical protein